MILIAVSQDVKTLEGLVVVHDVEFAMKRKVVYEVGLPIKCRKLFMALINTHCNLVTMSLHCLYLF